MTDSPFATPSPNRGSPAREVPRRLSWALFVLGVGFSGFFDGILLHQVLQWHHLLSLVEGPEIQDPRVQIMADGLFHVLMYGVALFGLWLLWRRGGRRSRARDALASFLVGFGAWNLVDVALFHWVLGIHHIRVDVTDWLSWDVGWLAVFGIVPLAAGIGLLRGAAGGPLLGPHRAAVIGALIIGAGVWSATPARSPGPTAVLFRSGVSEAGILTAIGAVDARLIGYRRGVAVVRLKPGTSPWTFYRHGAVLVSGAGPAGCFARLDNLEA